MVEKKNTVIDSRTRCETIDLNDDRKSMIMLREIFNLQGYDTKQLNFLPDKVKLKQVIITTTVVFEREKNKSKSVFGKE